MHGTITLQKSLGQLSITDPNLVINGPSAYKLAVSGGDASRVFDISSGTNVTISGLTITHGLSDYNSSVTLSTFGGGILNQGTLTLNYDIVSDNQAVGATDETVERHLGGGAGGGVANSGTLNVTGSTFIGNLAKGTDGSTGAFAFSSKPPDLNHIFFPGLGIGGGLLNLIGGTATVTDSSFIDNVAQGGSGNKGTFAGFGQGGGIGFAFSPTNITVSNCKVRKNLAIGGPAGAGGKGGSGRGGGVFNGSGSTTNVSISSITYNRVSGDSGDNGGDGQGGGFCNIGKATLDSNTIKFNKAKAGAAATGGSPGKAQGGGGYHDNGAGASITVVGNNVILHNKPDDKFGF